MQHGGIEWEANLIAHAHRLARSYEEARPGNIASPGLEDVHGAFHRALVNACDSSRLLRMRQQLFDESERHRRFDARIIAAMTDQSTKPSATPSRMREVR